MFFHWVDYAMSVLFEVRVLIDDIWYIQYTVRITNVKFVPPRQCLSCLLANHTVLVFTDDIPHVYPPNHYTTEESPL